MADLKIVEDYAEELRNLLSNSSLAEQKAFIRSFVKEVKVTDKKVERFQVQYNLVEQAVRYLELFSSPSVYHNLIIQTL